MTHKITGIFNILATPFTADKAVDIPSLRKLVQFQLDTGVYGLTILGVLGEAAKLTVDERRQVMETVVETVNGRVPIVVGTSHAQVETVIALSQAAKDAGAAAVMIAPPRMPNATDDEIIALYQRVADAVDVNIVVQDFPPVNGVIMSAPMLARLAEQIPAARYLKLEDPPLMEKIGEILELTDKFEIFGGLGGMFLLEELGRGASGTMTGFAWSEILIAVFEAFKAGNMAQAEAIFDRYLPLIRFENQPIINLTIRKELLYRRGAMATPLLRDPFVPVSAGTQAEIDWILKRVGIEDPTQILTFDAVAE
jgi:4-hydroxy-tetrahydrodipicolinate synthase